MSVNYAMLRGAGSASLAVGAASLVGEAADVEDAVLPALSCAPPSEPARDGGQIPLVSETSECAADGRDFRCTLIEADDDDDVPQIEVKKKDGNGNDIVYRAHLAASTPNFYLFLHEYKGLVRMTLVHRRVLSGEDEQVLDNWTDGRRRGGKGKTNAVAPVPFTAADFKKCTVKAAEVAAEEGAAAREPLWIVDVEGRNPLNGKVISAGMRDLLIAAVTVSRSKGQGYRYFVQALPLASEQPASGKYCDATVFLNVDHAIQLTASRGILPVRSPTTITDVLFGPTSKRTFEGLLWSSGKGLSSFLKMLQRLKRRESIDTGSAVLTYARMLCNADGVKEAVSAGGVDAGAAAAASAASSVSATSAAVAASGGVSSSSSTASTDYFEIRQPGDNFASPGSVLFCIPRRIAALRSRFVLDDSLSTTARIIGCPTGGLKCSCHVATVDGLTDGHRWWHTKGLSPALTRTRHTRPKNTRPKKKAKRTQTKSDASTIFY